MIFTRPSAPHEAKAQGRQQRILDSLLVLMEHTAWRQLTVKEVSMEAGFSPAGFYQYFTELEPAVLMLAQQLENETPPHVLRVVRLLAEEGYPQAAQIYEKAAPSDFSETELPLAV